MNLWSRLWNRFRPPEGRLTFFLLALAALNAAWGAMAANWVPGDELFWHTALVAILLGKWLGRTRIRWGWGTLLLAVGGTIYVGWCVTHLASPLWAALGAAWREEWSLALTWLQEAQLRVTALAREVVAWTGSWFGSGERPGPTVSLSLMALLIWGGSAFAGWSVARRRLPLPSFLPLGGAVALSAFLSEKGTEFLILLFACAVMTTPPLFLRRQEQDWDARQVPYSEEFRFDVWQVAIVSTIVFATVALLCPNLQVRAMVEWFWEQTQGPQQTAGEVLERTFPGTRPAAWRGSQVVGAVLPREHLLGGSVELGRRVVMHVATSDPPPVLDQFVSDEVLPRQTFYWRGTTYGEYVGVGWKQGPSEVAQQPAYAALGPPELPGRRPLRQEFTLLVPHGDTLYAAGEPQSIDQAVTVRRLPGGGELIGVEGQADHYRVLSLVPKVTMGQPEQSSAAYPADVVQVYLSLPEGLPQRMLDLAEEVTAGAETPYARALALETFLRSYPYDLEIPTPPEGQDLVDYFLFDLQRGYCDYYASAMVVMARSVGIPARLAVGYTTGYYDRQRGVYVVTEADAHTWPELYFPEYGWIPFEPTSGVAPLERPPDAEGIGISPPPAAAPPERPWWVQLKVEARLVWLRWRWWVLAGVGGLLLAWLTRRVWRYRPARVGEKGRAALGYFRLRDAAARLGIAVHPSDTPAEFAAAVAHALGRRRPAMAWLRPIVRRDTAEVMRGLSLVVSVYERFSYAPSPPDPQRARTAWRKGWHLRWRLWRLRAFSVAGR